MPQNAPKPAWAKIFAEKTGKELLQANPVYFIENVLTHANKKPFVLQDYQQEILGHIAPDTVVRGGRRGGKSLIFGGYGAWFGATHSNRQIWVIGPTLDQSRIIFNEIAGHFRRPPLNLLVDGRIKDYPFPYIRLLNGTEFHGRGANSPAYIRGHEAHLLLDDEAAFFKEGVLGNVIEPMMLTTGHEPDSSHIRVSTPFGHGEFYDIERYCRECMERGDTSAIAHHFTSLQNQYADRKKLQQILDRYGEDSVIWQTEYLANFVDDDLAVFPWRDIRWAYENFPYRDPQNLSAPEFPFPPQPGHRYVQGVDLANARDYFVASVFDATDPYHLVLVRMDRFRSKGWEAIKSTIRSNYSTYFGARTLIDATTMAENVVSDLSDISAEGYKFTSQSKYELIQDYARLLSEQRICFPYQRDMVDEHRFYEYEILPSKRLRMEAGQGHDDIVTSFALAARLGAVLPALGFFMSVDFSRPRPLTASKPVPGYDPVAEWFRFDTD